jgi:phosphoglycolate phosphatase
MLIKRAHFDAVCWDWNGTLLDDVGVARAAMNTVLRDRQLPVIPDEDAYRQVFGFPIRGFYSRLGLDECIFVEAADQYLKLFAQTVGEASLQLEAGATLAAIGALGVEQVLISATPEDVLEQQLAPHAVDAHFSRILGITDVYTASKAHVVESWLKGSGHDPRRVLMVGDTNHDEEIAEALNVHFLRFARGHQQSPDHRRHPVVHDLRDVVSYLRQANTSDFS